MIYSIKLRTNKVIQDSYHYTYALSWVTLNCALRKLVYL